MPTLISKRPPRTAVLLVTLVCLTGASGCTSGLRFTHTPQAALPGFSRIQDDPTPEQPFEITEEDKAQSADAVANAPTTLSDAAQEAIAEELVADATAEESSDIILVQGKSEQKKRSGLRLGPLERLQFWKHDEDDKQEEQSEKKAGQPPEQRPPQPPAVPNAAKPEEQRKPISSLRSRGRRLLSLLRFPWDNDKQEEMEELANDENLPAEQTIPEEEQLGVISDEPEMLTLAPPPQEKRESIEELVDLEAAAAQEELREKEPVERHLPSQPWSKVEPNRAPTGVSNRSIATLAELESRPSSRESGSQIEEEQTQRDYPRFSITEDNTRAATVTDHDVQREAIRRNLLPDISILPEESTVIERLPPEPEVEPAPVVRIPNRLPAPKIRGRAGSWSHELANTNMLLYISIGIVVCMLAYGAWRRMRGSEDV